VRAILEDYTSRSVKQFSVADYGCWLDSEEQRRRYIIKSLLRWDGLNATAYRDRFDSAPLEDFPSLSELEEFSLAYWGDESLRLSKRGFEHSDVIGPWLSSTAMRARMDSFALT
jgi:oxygen-independent coproporphyrinogen-3 oxidase